ncbi:MAG: efflux RND transporter periplasmic adaptor subunit [Lachnospiraceae bacterium]|nr:efflux RND transporter periplasmic adaptor subunit [Lachnospiraceae bacterium]
MHNIKRKTALLSLALCMTFGMAGCKNQNDSGEKDLSDYLVTLSDQDNHKTSYEIYTLELSDYSSTFGAIASAKYQETPVIADIPYGNPVPMGYSVANNRAVNEGAPILRYRLEFDEVYMAEQRLAYTRKSERFEAYKVKEEKRLAELAKEVSQLPSDSEAFAEALEDYQDQEKAYNEYVEDTQAEIDKLAEEVAAFEGNGKIFTINAPVSGVISLPFQMYFLNDGMQIATINDPKTDIYAVDNQFGNFMVGQKVMGDYADPNGDKHTVEGVVLSVDSLLPLRLQSGSAYIRFNFPENVKMPPDTVHAVVEAEKMKDVIRIPISLVRHHYGADYIEILTDEGITQRNIEVFTEAGQDYIVLDASLAGTKVVKR